MLACDKFVKDGNDSGPGVKFRILSLFQELAKRSTKAAQDPAARILQDNFLAVSNRRAWCFRELGRPAAGDSRSDRTASLGQGDPRDRRTARQNDPRYREGYEQRAWACAPRNLMTQVLTNPALVSYNGSLRAVLRCVPDFGFETYDLAAPPRRLLSARTATPLVETGVDVRRVERVPPPSALLQGLPGGESWLGVSQRTLARVSAAFLVGEDPQRRLDAQSAATLMHQLSLVQHVVENPSLRKVLIADEVGLGKTIEAGLLVKRVLEGNTQLRVLYLAPARLVSNVAFEFRDKLNLDARRWVAGSAADARLDDDRLVVASIHKAVFGDNLQRVVESGPWDVLIVDECHHLSDWGMDGGEAK